MQIDILSLFPGYFKGPLDESIINQARKKKIIEVGLVDIRDFAEGRNRRVDDRPFGGGPGMVMKAEPVMKAIESVKKPQSHVVYLSPQGTPLTAAKCRELAAYQHLVLLCGHYEGIDERVLESGIVNEVISIGDYVLTNGCLAAIVVLDAAVRFIPGVLGHDQAANNDSFEKEIFDCPHYTHPRVYAGREVPAVLFSGNHKKIEEWRLAAAIEKTRRMRPDLLSKYLLNDEKDKV